ncbi:MAG: glycosyltransferase 87 family protein [Mycobacteriales bacterium]
MLRRAPGLLAGTVTAVLVGLLLHQRSTQHLVNVDDYLYSRQTDLFWEALTSGRIGIVDAWKLFAVNSPLVPALASPIAAFSASPGAFVLVQVPLALGLLAGAAALLRRTGVAGPAKWAAALAAVAMPPVLTYTAMLSFAVAASLCTVATLAVYLSTQRLRLRWQSALLGLLFGLLSLSRVVALVYAAAIGLPMAVDLLLDRGDWRRRVQNLGITIAVAFAVAAPWWLTAGPKAMDYLLDAGYSSGSVFTSDTSPLRTELNRLTHTADETGWLLAWLLVAVWIAGLASSVVSFRRERTEAARATILVATAVPIGMVLLGTSSNAGTAFALPFEVLAVVIAVAGLRSLIGRAVLALAGVAVAVAATAVFTSDAPSAWHGHELWLAGIPARAQQQAALGCRCALPDVAELNRDVYDLIGTAPTLILRDDAMVNPESLRWLAQLDRKDLQLAAPPGATVDAGQLAATEYVLAGSTPAPYLGVNLAAAEQALPGAGFHKVFTRRLSAASTVEVWSR